MQDYEYEVTVLDFEPPKLRHSNITPYWFPISFETMYKFRRKRLNNSEIVMHLVLTLLCTQLGEQSVRLRANNVRDVTFIRPRSVRTILEGLETKGFIVLHN